MTNNSCIIKTFEQLVSNSTLVIRLVFNDWKWYLKSDSPKSIVNLVDQLNSNYRDNHRYRIHLVDPFTRILNAYAAEAVFDLWDRPYPPELRFQRDFLTYNDTQQVYVGENPSFFSPEGYSLLAITMDSALLSAQGVHVLVDKVLVELFDYVYELSVLSEEDAAIWCLKNNIEPIPAELRKYSDRQILTPDKLFALATVSSHKTVPCENLPDETQPSRELGVNSTVINNDEDPQTGEKAVRVELGSENGHADTKPDTQKRNRKKREINSAAVAAGKYVKKARKIDPTKSRIQAVKEWAEDRGHIFDGKPISPTSIDRTLQDQPHLWTD